jgi:hypothetical protein
MMASVKPEEAERFYEEDEDPARVFALFDTARREGRVRHTAPGPRPDLIPLRALLAALARDLWRDLRQLRLPERAGRALRHLADAIESRGKVH